MSRRKELGDFLIKCRARRTPTDAGLPSGPRRKTPGLRREEVAALAGIGPAWYTWLEQGRSIKVSVSTLDAIANALGMTRPEREHMFRLAEVTASRPLLDAVHVDAEVPAVVRAIIEKLEPYPCCVYDLSYDVLLCNQSYAACFPELISASSEKRNILYYFSQFDSIQMAAHESLVRAVIGRFRANYSTNIDHPRWRQIISEAILKNDQMKGYWEDHVVNSAMDSIDTVNAAVGEITFMSTSFSMGASPEVNVVVGIPKADRDRELLEELLNVAES